MAETAKQVLTARTRGHSDVATTEPAKAHQAALTERQFGDTLLKQVREAKGELRLGNFREEWISTDDGLVHEMSVEMQAAEP